MGAEVVLGLAFDVLGFAFVVLGVAFSIFAFAWAVLVVTDVILLRFAGCFPFTFCRTLLPPVVADVLFLHRSLQQDCQTLSHVGSNLWDLGSII